MAKLAYPRIDVLGGTGATSSFWLALVKALSNAPMTRRAFSKVKHNGGVIAITLRSSPWVATITFCSFNLWRA